MTMPRRRVLIPTLVLCGVAVWCVFAWRTPESSELERIEQQLEQGDPKSGIDALRAYLVRHPQDARANYLAGLQLARTNPRLATPYLQRVPRDAADRAAAVRLLAAIYLEARELDAAQEQLTELREHAPDDVAVSLGWVEFHLVSGEHTEALQEAYRAAALEPTRAQTHLLIAELLDELSRTAESVEPLRRAVELDPELFPARANLAYALQFIGDHQAALRELEWCLEREPNNAGLLLIQAEILRDEGDLPAAKQIIQQVLRAHRQDLKSSLLLAEILLFEDRPQEALALLEPLVFHHRDHHHLTTLLARAATLAGQTEKARIYQQQQQDQLPPRTP
jgi:predicted Zn-dependent protease